MSYYYTRDHLGSVREMLDSSGSIVSRLSYDPYGKTTVVSGTNLPTKGYAGMYWHQASQQYTTVNRLYRPDVALWDSRDPKGEKGGLNLYEYCDDDPAEEVDTLGLAGTTLNITVTTPTEPSHEQPERNPPGSPSVMAATFPTMSRPR